MVPFFDTHYVIRRPRPAVFDLCTDFSRYLDRLPAFQGCALESEPGPVGEGKVYRIAVPDGRYRTRVELIELGTPERFVYDFQYIDADTGALLSGKASPMPWDRARMILTFTPDAGRTWVDSRMWVAAHAGLAARWRIARLKALAARAQPEANAAMVRVAEQTLVG